MTDVCRKEGVMRWRSESGWVLASVLGSRRTGR